MHIFDWHFIKLQNNPEQLLETVKIDEKCDEGWSTDPAVLGWAMSSDCPAKNQSTAY